MKIVIQAEQGIKMKGKYRLSFVTAEEVAKIKEKGPRSIEKDIKAEGDNLIVYTGQHWAADRLFNYNMAAYTAGGELGYLTHMGLGTGLATNSGVPGPDTGITPTTGVWQGPSLADWRLTGEIYGNGGCRAAVQGHERTDSTMYCYSIFTNAQFDYSGGACNIREVGLFLSDTGATANPDDIVAQRPYTMVSRHCFYQQVGANYQDWPISKLSDGMSVMIEYEMTIN